MTKKLAESAIRNWVKQLINCRPGDYDEYYKDIPQTPLRDEECNDRIVRTGWLVKTTGTAPV